MSDKRLYTELLLLYKDFPCLWDSRQLEYANREAKNQAYDILLEKFREIEPQANLSDLKKKLEHMRATYRREHKKVLLAQLRGDERGEYTPKLWYYDLMLFLNEVGDFSRLEPIPRGSRKDKPQERTHYSKRASSASSVGAKRRKSPPNTVYLDDGGPDSDEDEMVNDDDDYEPTILYKSGSINQSTFVSTSDTTASTSNQEWESFGTTVGLQLKDLEPTQRIIAEKLISDIIFDARFNKLTPNTSIVHN